LVSHLYTPDFCDTRCDHNDNRSHTDAPLSSKLCLLPRRVRHSSIFFSFSRSEVDVIFRSHESPQVSSLVFPKTKPTDTPPTAPDRVEVSVHGLFEQHPTGRTNDDDSSTAVSTSESQMFHIFGVPSKLNLAPESTWPLPTV